MGYSTGNSFDEILERCLANERLASVDKRVGSIIYDALAPICLELAEAYIKMDIMDDQSYLLTATGTNLEKRVYDYGIVREEATKAERVGYFKRYLLNSNNDYVYSYKQVTENTGNFDIDEDAYEFVGKGNGQFLHTSKAYAYVGDNQGDYSLVVTHVGARNGNYIYNETYGVYINVGNGNGNYTVNATNVGENNGSYTYESDAYVLVGSGEGDYNNAFVEVGDNQGDYIQDERLFIDMDIPVGSRFSLPSDSNLIFKFTGVRTIYDETNDVYVDYNVLECESEGSGGNTYMGVILPLTPIVNLANATMGGVLSYGEDEESDEELRTRARSYLNEIAFGGNIDDYTNKVGAIDGVGGVKVFPAYMNPTQAVLSLKTNNHNIVAEELANIGAVIRLHSQYKYVGSGEGSYSLVANEYVEDEDGDYDLITGGYPITDVKKLDFDGSVKVCVVNTDYSPMSSDALLALQNKIDPPTHTGEGVGIAPIGHYVTVVTPTESTLSVTLTVALEGSSIEYEKPKIETAIINYVNSVRAKFGQKDLVTGQYIPLRVYVTQLTTLIQNECPNVASITNVLLNGQSVNYVQYDDTAYEQYIPKTTVSNITIYEST